MTSKPDASARPAVASDPLTRAFLVAKRFVARYLPRRKWLRTRAPSETQHLFGLTLLVGLVCGVAAVAFHLTIRAVEALLIERALTAPGSSWMVWTILSPTLGGLLAGACLTWIVPGARGSGVPQVKVAYASEGGRVRFRDAVGKFVIGAVQIGSGASLGREGPTAQICAGAASLLARITALPPRQMRKLTPVGVAAGIAAAFNAPIAAVTFTIEEIVGTLDNTVLSGVVVAAALAAMIERSVLGVHPVIQLSQQYGLAHASSLATYALLGIAAGIISVVFTDGLLKLRLWFRDTRIVPRWTQPAIGGLVTGILAVLALHQFHLTGVNGGGYATLDRALAGDLGFRALLALGAIKIIATVFSYSSGGAGGIFAPALFIGAMLGGAFGYGDVLLFDHERAQLGAFALVGMGAVFAGVIRAPITSVLIIFEMTGGYGLVLPLMLANMTSYALARSVRSLPIYEALLAQDGIELPSSSTRTHLLERLTVANAMTTAVRRLRPNQTLATAAADLKDKTFAIAPIVDERGVVTGAVSLAELRRVAALTPEATVSTLSKPVETIRANEPLLEAIICMTDRSVRQLCVVSKSQENRLVGIVAMSDVVQVHARAAHPAKPRQATKVATEVRVANVLRDAVVVGGATKLIELEGMQSHARSLIVQLPDRYAALLAEDLQRLVRDDNLNMLTAADVAQTVPVVSSRATLDELVRALHDADASALIVQDEAGQDRLGIISRADLASALLDWYAVASSAPSGSSGRSATSRKLPSAAGKS